MSDTPKTGIEKYRIVQAGEAVILAKTVGHCIEFGWEPIGGVCIKREAVIKHGLPERFTYYQSMVLND